MKILQIPNIILLKTVYTSNERYIAFYGCRFNLKLYKLENRNIAAINWNSGLVK